MNTFVWPSNAGRFQRGGRQPSTCTVTKLDDILLVPTFFCRGRRPPVLVSLLGLCWSDAEVRVILNGRIVPSTKYDSIDNLRRWIFLLYGYEIREPPNGGPNVLKHIFFVFGGSLEIFCCNFSGLCNELKLKWLYNRLHTLFLTFTVTKNQMRKLCIYKDIDSV